MESTIVLEEGTELTNVQQVHDQTDVDPGVYGIVCDQGIKAIRHILNPDTEQMVWLEEREFSTREELEQWWGEEPKSQGEGQ